MKNNWRLLRDNIIDPQKHFAVEEALLRGIEKGITPSTLRIRQYKPSVWIGIYQDIDEEINLKYCQKNNIPVIRRHNPGGAVYQDDGSFCFSAFFNKKSFFNSLSITDPDKLYELIGKVVMKTLKYFDIDANISSLNDITVNNKKVYGSAQIELYSAFSHSGTFLIDVDLNKMQKVLSPSNLKFIDKGFTSVKNRVLNVNDILDKRVKKEEVITKFINSFSDFFNLDLKKENLKKDEISIINDLYKNKYSTYEWTHKKFPSSSIKVSKKAKSGVINLHCKLDKKNKYIKKVYLTGDFLVQDSKSILDFYNKIENTSLKNASKKIKKLSLPENIQNNLIELFDKIKKEVS